MSDIDADGLVEQYIAAWNEPQPERRAVAAVQLWAPDGAVINSRFEYRGHARVIEAITRSYERFISAGYRYRAREQTSNHHCGVCILWQMLDPQGAADSFGANFLLLNQQGQIQLDYQFVEA